LRLDIEPSADCIFDSVRAWDGNATLILTTCGNATLPEVYSASNAMRVAFRSDDAFAKSGFSAVVRSRSAGDVPRFLC
jgi:hypothetical protein